MEQKKVLILSASPRRGGNSDSLCDRFAAGAREAGHAVTKVFLRDKQINYCLGCGTCYNRHKPCPQTDDADAVIGMMVEADVIVLASPVYFYSVNAQLKTLIDRACARYTEISGKDFYFVAAMAEDDRSRMERTFEAMRGFTDCLPGARERGVIAATGVWQKGEVEGTAFMEQAYEMGRNL